MQRRAAQAVVEVRGVYWAPYTKNGRPVLYAIKSDGDELRPRLVLQPNTPPDLAVEYLWRLLDQQDPPRPTLKLVTESPHPEPINIHDIIDGTTWTRMQYDSQLRMRVLRHVRELEQARRQH